MDWTQVYVAIFIMALTLSLILTPLCGALAKKSGFLDIPWNEKHKGHERATPLLGGMAMFGAWILTCGAALAAASCFLPGGTPQQLAREIAGMARIRSQLFVIMSCAGASLALGTADDRFALSPQVKLIGQFLIAVVSVIFGGVRIFLFIRQPLISGAVTVFWIVFLFNAINFFDNMDGLACGAAAIAFLFFSAAAIVNGQYFIVCLGVCSAGAAIGFWFYNCSPASIFMGDGGSHFLAYLLAVVSARVTYYNPGVSASPLTVLIPLFILAVPLFDTFAVVMIRLLKRQPVYVGDRNHISHRLCRMGMSRKRAVWLVHLLCLIFGLGAMPLLWGDARSCFILFAQGAAILLLLTILQYSGKRIMPGQGSSSKE